MIARLIFKRMAVNVAVFLSIISNCTAETNTLFNCGDTELKSPFLDDFVSGDRVIDETEKPQRIETDRHDFTQSTETVGQGIAQFEAGYTYFYDEEDGEKEETHTGPELMLRVGITENIEFRARWNHVWRFGGEGESLSGSEDTRLGLKVRTTDQSCWIPESALELRMAVPTGGEAWSTTRVEFGFDYVYGWRLTEVMEIYGSTGFSSNGLGDFALLPEIASESDFVVLSQSIALGFEATEDITVYTEFFGFFSHGPEVNNTQIFFNLGADYYFTESFVLDLRFGEGLTKGAEDVFAGFGGGYRF